MKNLDQVGFERMRAGATQSSLHSVCWPVLVLVLQFIPYLGIKLLHLWWASHCVLGLSLIHI